MWGDERTQTNGYPLNNETVEWFLMVHINGVRYTSGDYKDLTLIPSFYRSFTGKHNPNDADDDGDWDVWKDFRIYRASYDDWERQGKETDERATSVTLTHEVWDHNANCPVHRRKPVTVGVGSDPVAPTASISDATGIEGGVLRFRVTLSRTSQTPVTVRYETAGGTALEGTDYDAASDTLTFGPGTIERTFEVQTREDTTDEPNETFTVTLSDPSGATLGDADAVGTIFDDDATALPPVLLISDATAFEGEVLSFQVTLNRTSDTLVMVDYETAGGTALEGTDYYAASGALTFEPGTMERTFEVRTREDTADEPNETFTVTLSDPNGATLGDADAVGTIFDDDEPALPPVLLISDASAVEGEVLSFQVTLSRTSDTLVAVDYETAGGTALEGTDYYAASGALTFEPGTMERTLDVRTREDTIDEPNETFTVRLSDPGGATLGDFDAVGTIFDDDEPPPPVVSISDASAFEGGVLRFRVTLSRTSQTPVTVYYETAGGTALEGTDYDAASDTLTFGRGTIERTFEVQTREDTIDEPNETFTVTLSVPSGATLGDADAVGTIFDDDATALPPVLLISDASAFEGEVLRFQVTLSRSSDTPVTVRYETAGGTALEGTDYDAESDTLTFGPGIMERTFEV